MKTLEDEPIVEVPLRTRAELLGIDDANLAGLPLDVAAGCLDFVAYATGQAVKQYLDNPNVLLSTVEATLGELMTDAIKADTDTRNEIIAKINLAIACETADPQRVVSLGHKAGQKLDNWASIAKGNFTNHLTSAQAASRTGRVLSQEEIAKSFEIIGIPSHVIAEKLGVTLSESQTPVDPVIASKAASTPPTFSVAKEASTTPEQLRPRFTVNVVKSSQRIGGAAAVGAMVFTLAAPATAQATETTPTISSSPTVETTPSATSTPTEEAAPQAPEPVAVQEIGPNGTAVDITPSDTTPDSPPPENTTVTKAPDIADATQPSEVSTDPAVTVTTTVNPITGQVTTEQAPAKPAEANTPRENNQLATELIAKLTPGFREAIVRLNRAIGHESLNYLSHSGDDVYGTKDPETHKVIPIKIDGEYAKTLQAQYEALVAILANDQTFIKSVNDMFEQMPLDANKQAIIDTVAKVKFTEDGVADFEPAQKTATLAYITYISNQTQTYAQKIVDARIAEYQKAYDKAHPKKPTPEIEHGDSITEALIDKVAQKYDWPTGKIIMLKTLIKLGVSLPAAAGMMGNAKGESGYRSNAVEKGSKIGFGYFQWSFGRRDRLEAAAKEQGVDAADPVFQINYAINESKHRSQRDNSEANEWEGLISIKDPEVAAAYWQWNFERPSAKSTQNVRTAEALSVYRQITNELNANNRIRLSTIDDIPKDVGSRYTTQEIADAAKPGESMFGPDDPCAKLIGNVRIICAAEKFLGIRYGTKDPAYAPKWEKIWGEKITSWGGHNPERWILDRSDFLECSGYVAVAIKVANNVDVDNCSAGFLSDKKNFKQINPHKIRPGDLVIASKHCGGKQGGHVGLVVSYNPKTGDLTTLEASAGTSSEGFARTGFIKHHKIGVDFHYAARYIGPGSDADLNS